MNTPKANPFPQSTGDTMNYSNVDSIPQPTGEVANCSNADSFLQSMSEAANADSFPQSTDEASFPNGEAMDHSKANPFPQSTGDTMNYSNANSILQPQGENMNLPNANPIPQSTGESVTQSSGEALFPKAQSFSQSTMRERSMGPNPLKICEELLAMANIPAGSVVLDLGSGAGLTSALMAREYGFTVYAADLWSDPSDNMRFFEACGLGNRQVIPLKEDATALPFASGFFDAVVSVDSYNYFGRDPEYLGTCLLPLVKRGGELLFAIPGMVRDCHDDLPACLLASWTPEQLDYMHDMAWWRANIERTAGAQILDMRELACTREAWADWLTCDNEYAVGDRAAVEAGALDYLNTIAIRLKRK